MEGRKISK